MNYNFISKTFDTWTYNLHSEVNGVLAAVAIGEEYFERWQIKISENWIRYAERFNLAIIVFQNHLCDENASSWRPPPWQKLLVPYAVKEVLGRDTPVLIIDPDILISPLAPNAMEFISPKLISVVSQVHNLPYPLEEVRRRIAFLRNRFYDQRYPLDSLLFASVEQIYIQSGLAPQKDYFCGGFLLLDTQDFANTFVDWFSAIPSNSRIEKSCDLSWGEEIYINHAIQINNLANWLDYKFQAIWIYEMAWKYPNLYAETSNIEFAQKCIESSLWSCYFLHFAGSWNDSELWKTSNPKLLKKFISLLNDFEQYCLVPVTGQPVGRILPRMK